MSDPTPPSHPAGRVIPFKRPRKKPEAKKWHLPNRNEIAYAAESASRTFLSLALFAEMTAKVLRAVSSELNDKRRR